MPPGKPFICFKFEINLLQIYFFSSGKGIKTGNWGIAWQPSG